MSTGKAVRGTRGWVEANLMVNPRLTRNRADALFKGKYYISTCDHHPT